MLVDLDFDCAHMSADHLKHLKDEYDFSFESDGSGGFVTYMVIDDEKSLSGGAERIESGLYYTDLNFGGMIGLFTKYKEVPSYRPEIEKELGILAHSPYSYGVCDTVEQWKDRFHKQWDDLSLPCIVSFTPIVKAHQPEWGGWRWHKWGEYIGNHEIRCEYLFNEVGIEEVLVYHVAPPSREIDVTWKVTPCRFMHGTL